MGYRLKRRASVEADIGRIMSEQLAKAGDALDAIDQDPEEAIHELRKRCKKIRGAARLVRPASSGGRYSRINGLARDAAREVADHRDTTVMAATFDRLVERGPEGMGDARARDTIAAVLTAQRSSTAQALGSQDPTIARARTLLAELSDEIDDLELDDTGFDAIGPGLAKTYGRGRAALEVAIGAPTAANFHELRKRAKYTRNHVALIGPAAPKILEPLGHAFHAVTDGLGDAHDLAVLGAWLRSEVVDEIDRREGTSELRIVVDGARSELEHRAVALGRRLYAETPKRFARRLEVYWETWRSEESRSPAGGLDLALG